MKNMPNYTRKFIIQTVTLHLGLTKFTNFQILSKRRLLQTENIFVTCTNFFRTTGVISNKNLSLNILW